MSVKQAEELLQQLDTFNRNPKAASLLGPELRARLSAAARTTSLKLESPVDTTTRVLLNQPMELVVMRLATDMDLFTKLTKPPRGPKALDYLVEEIGSERDFLAHILRALVAFQAVTEPKPQHYAATPSYASFVRFEDSETRSNCIDFMGKLYNAYSNHFAETGYKIPSDPQNTVMRRALDMKGIPPMEVFSDHLEACSAKMLMQMSTGGFGLLYDRYPLPVCMEVGFDPSVSDVMLIDVGGGMGPKAAELKKTFPDLPGRFLVQFPARIGAALQYRSTGADVEMSVHDYTAEQPVRSARVYYVHRCLHALTDDVCVAVLGRLRAAGKEDYSHVLIHELVLPEGGGVSSWAATHDFLSMGMYGVPERTERQWRRLCERAGLRVVGLSRPLGDHPSGEGIVEAKV